MTDQTKQRIEAFVEKDSRAAQNLVQTLLDDEDIPLDSWTVELVASAFSTCRKEGYSAALDEAIEIFAQFGRDTLRSYKDADDWSRNWAEDFIKARKKMEAALNALKGKGLNAKDPSCG